MLPNRLDDFIRYYEKTKSRKNISNENYTIEDYLQGIELKNGFNQIIVGPNAAIPKFTQQLAILNSLENRFVSTLYDVRTMVQADFFDSELEAALELLKHKFYRAAGALAGVVLEKHLKETCNNHKIKLKKKSPSISDYNEALKSSKVIEIPDWRYIQHLADIRNLCDHSKEVDPTSDQINDLLSGVKKIIKTIF